MNRLVAFQLLTGKLSIYEIIERFPRHRCAESFRCVGFRHIYIFERLEESAALNMELAREGLLVRSIGITSEELENYFIQLVGGEQNA